MSKSENPNMNVNVIENKQRGVTTKFFGRRLVKDLESGEVIELEYAEKSVKRGLKRGWQRVYLEDFMEILTSFANKKVEVVEFILNNLNSENQLTLTYRDITERSDVSYKTVADTFKELQKMDFIKKVGTIWLVNPKFVCAFGSDQKNANILIKYQEEEQNLFN